jgi:hypothetical protein
MTPASFVASVAVLTILLPAGLRSEHSSPGEPVLPDTSRPFGLILDTQAEAHLSSPGTVSDGGYSYSLGFGLNFSSRFQMTMQIYTGKENIHPGSVKPVDGWLPLGGASLEATLFFTSGSPVRPYGAAGYGLYTLNGGDGYNGWGVHCEAGVEWEFSRYVSVRGGAEYSVRRFHDPTGEAYQAIGFEPFTLHFFGAAIRCAFYPSVLP